MKYCVKCGHELAEGAKFCPACGNPVAVTEMPVANDPVEKSVKTGEPTQKATVVQPSQDTKTDSVEAEGAQPQLGFVGSVQYIMQHVFEFNGNTPESRKSVFWWGFVAVYLVNFILIFIPVVGELLAWATSILLVSAIMRRLTYIGKNAGIGWLMMIPIVAIYPIVLMFMDKKG
ncbi:zinc-ribbon domain-containing protein [Levilactobacillus sp. HBUAS70063]|uniref:zinc-ribbon domain-containing protein n=1 Tax=Levilactobacillus sp. HBUAS70063 TaxID=3109359 RepID=UPI003132F178